MQNGVRSGRATILVVDDNAANRALAQGTLEDEGHEVVLASNGIEALRAFESSRPDCVLLDVRMPEMDGFVACERIRALPGGGDTPVVFLTAMRDVDTFDRALRAGGDDFLSKPLHPAELVVRVQSALKMRRMGAELREHYALHKQQRDDMLRLQLQKERLMTFVVHDLKNPVNSLDLHAQLLLRDRSLPQSARDSAAQIRREARRLTRMILNLLDISKAEEGKLAPKCSRFTLQLLIDDLISELGINAQSRNVTLRAEVGLDELYVDEDLFRRALTNLLENAVRHAPSHTAVTLSLARVGQAVEIRVADAGPGIPAPMRQKIFEPYVQVEVGERQLESTGRGLGLSFCKLAVEAHGGSIWAEDAAPGTVFCIRLPQHD